MNYNTNGAFGDTIASLPVVKYYKGGTLWLDPDWFIEDRFNNIAPLLRKQPYLQSVINGKCFEKDVLDLSRWKQRAKWGKSIAETVATVAFTPENLTKDTWLEVDPSPIAPVIFTRCKRYHWSDDMWIKCWKRYPDAIFCGFEDEYNDIQKICTGISWYPTKNLLELAEIIAGAEVLCCNTSCPFWLGCGLGTNVIVEYDTIYNNCFCSRPNVLYVKTDHANELDKRGEIEFEKN